MLYFDARLLLNTCRIFARCSTYLYTLTNDCLNTGIWRVIHGDSLVVNFIEIVEKCY